MAAAYTPLSDATVDQPQRVEGQHRRQPLGLEPRIDPTARVRNCVLGPYTAVGPHTSMTDSTFGDYSYVVQGFRFGAPGKAKREEFESRRDEKEIDALETEI